MKIPQAEYLRNYNEGKYCRTPWTAIYMTVKSKKSDVSVIRTLFDRLMPKEDFSKAEKEDLLKYLHKISHDLTAIQRTS